MLFGVIRRIALTLIAVVMLALAGNFVIHDRRPESLTQASAQEWAEEMFRQYLSDAKQRQGDYAAPVVELNDGDAMVTIFAKIERPRA